MNTVAASRGMTTRGRRAVAVRPTIVLGTVASIIGSSFQRAAAGYSFSAAPATCQYTSVTARIAPAGSVIYAAVSTCTSGPKGGAGAISETVSYDPGTQSFGERFSYNEIEVRTAWPVHDVALSHGLVGQSPGNITLCVRGAPSRHPERQPGNRSVAGGSCSRQGLRLRAIIPCSNPGAAVPQKERGTRS
jgi:hypothetical protein